MATLVAARSPLGGLVACAQQLAEHVDFRYLEPDDYNELRWIMSRVSLLRGTTEG